VKLAEILSRSFDYCFTHPKLVGGLEHYVIIHIMGRIIIPTDEVHHFSEGWRKTTNQTRLRCRISIGGLDGGLRTGKIHHEL
jgi:hypothetical protein